MLKKLYNLNKLFWDFIACMKSHVTTCFYKAFWNVFSVVELLVSKYKKFISYYIIFILSNQYFKIEKKD